jgi:hypothetical protein
LRIDGDMGVCNFHMCIGVKKSMCRAMMSSERGKQNGAGVFCPMFRSSPDQLEFWLATDSMGTKRKNDRRLV